MNIGSIVFSAASRRFDRNALRSSSTWCPWSASQILARFLSLSPLICSRGISLKLGPAEPFERLLAPDSRSLGLIVRLNAL